MPRTNRKRRQGTGEEEEPWKKRRLGEKWSRVGVKEETDDTREDEDDEFWSRMATGVRDQSASSDDAPLQDNVPDGFDETERAAYLAQRSSERKEHLEEMRRVRVEALALATASPSVDVVTPPETILTRPTFDLMSRTAKALHSSPNAMQLETKIYANHGSDPRFVFLRADGGSAVREIWLRLKRGEHLKWEDVSGTAEKSGTTLLSGYDSEPDSRTSDEDRQPCVDVPIPAAEATDADKVAERRARARQWAATQRERARTEDKQEAPPFDIMEGALEEDGEAWHQEQDVIRIG